MLNKMCSLVQHFSMRGDENFELIFLYSAGNSFLPWDIEWCSGGGWGWWFGTAFPHLAREQITMECRITKLLKGNSFH